jgi:hypothetical protein
VLSKYKNIVRECKYFLEQKINVISSTIMFLLC